MKQPLPLNVQGNLSNPLLSLSRASIAWQSARGALATVHRALGSLADDSTRVILPDNDLPRPPPSPFFTFQMPPPSIAGRQIKRLRSSTSSGCDPFLVSLKQSPVGSSLYAPSRGSKREAPEVLPSSDDLGPVVFELEEGSVIDNEMDIDPVSSLEHHPEEDDIFSD